MDNVTNSFKTKAFIVKQQQDKAHESLILILTLVIAVIFDY